MSAFQRCPNTAELEPLYLPQELYLRPMAKMNISLQLPNVKKLGKSISHWEVMDRLRDLIKPDEFTVLKVTKTTVEFVRFEAEVEKKSKLERVISKLDNKSIKLKDFGEQMRVKAAEWKSDFPTRRVWDAYFQEAKDMDEMVPGQRPDTIHFWNMPSKWFTPYSEQFDDDARPSERIFYRVFEKFGNIRNVDIPICDPYRMKMKEHISGLKYSCHEKPEFFEAYVQFKDYIAFTKTMDFFRDKKLVRQEEENHVEIEIKVDFDKSKHLSDASIRRREIVRERLVKKAKEKEEKDKKHLEERKKEEETERKKEENIKTQKEIRRRMREEKRKAKILQKLEVTGSEEINEKIAREEKKLVKVQRKLEAIRIVEELFKRIQEKNRGNTQHYSGEPSYRTAEFTRLKNTRELSYLTQKEKLHHAVKSRVMLRTILSEDKPKTAKFSETSDSDESMWNGNARDRRTERPDGKHPAELMYEHHPHPHAHLQHHPPPQPMYGYHPTPFPPMYGGFMTAPHPGIIYPEIDIYAVYRGRGGLPRSGARAGFRGRGRGYRGRGRGGPGPGPNGEYPEEVFEDYVPRYTTKRFDRRDDHDDRRRSRSHSSHRSSRRSRSRSRSKSRHHRSRTRKRSYSRSRSRSHSKRRRSYTRSRTRSRSRSHRRHSRSRSRSRSKTRRRSRSRSKTRPRSRSRSKSRTKRSRTRSKSTSKNDRSQEEKRKSKSRSQDKSREKSVDSSQFMTPRQLQEQKQKSKSRSRSRSWSLPKDGEENKRSWSRSPGKKTKDTAEA